MTIRELIASLQALPPDLIVMVEYFSDGLGRVVTGEVMLLVEMDPPPASVLITHVDAR